MLILDLKLEVEDSQAGAHLGKVRTIVKQNWVAIKSSLLPTEKLNNARHIHVFELQPYTDPYDPWAQPDYKLKSILKEAIWKSETLC